MSESTKKSIVREIMDVTNCSKKVAEMALKNNPRSVDRAINSILYSRR